MESTRETHRRTSHLEDMNKAWTRRKKVKIDYRSKKGIGSYVLGIYCFEPYSEGLSLHVIGHCDDAGDIRHFKLERIESVGIL